MDGLQRHALWTMDGRTWVEIMAGESKMRDIAIQRGWCREIPQDMLESFIEAVKRAHQ